MMKTLCAVSAPRWTRSKKVSAREHSRGSHPKEPCSPADQVPSKKPITLADQIAVDSNGRRRFHGAFTGGFSAGYWNTVGSKDGWTPQSFKSSRSEKAALAAQKPDDFMDDEDVGEFGIAPQRIQTMEDFAPNSESVSEQVLSRNKRKLPTVGDGPIPGVPVLHLVLESCRDKAAVRLLKRMDPKLERDLLKRREARQKLKMIEAANETAASDEAEPSADAADPADGAKVYQCDMGPFQRRPAGGASDSDDSDDDDDTLNFEDLEIGADDYGVFAQEPKDNRFGLEYVGLSKSSVLGASSDGSQRKHFSLFPSSFEMVDKNNKRLSIKGQAFGVGAFEEDDDDIYAKDDMTNYDFSMNEKAASTSKATRAIEGPGSFIAGFVDASKSNQKASKKVFHVDVPRDYKPRNWVLRRSRFGPEVRTAKEPAEAEEAGKTAVGRHEMTPADRGKLLNEKSKKENVAKSMDADSLLEAVGLKTMSFVSEASSSGAAESTSAAEIPRSISPSIAESVEDIVKKVDDVVKTREFKPPSIIPEISDRYLLASVTEMGRSNALFVFGCRFVVSGSTAVKTEEKVKADEPVVEVTVVRTRSTWVPNQLLSYKMNVEAAVGYVVSSSEHSEANSESIQQNETGETEDVFAVQLPEGRRRPEAAAVHKHRRFSAGQRQRVGQTESARAQRKLPADRVPAKTERASACCVLVRRCGKESCAEDGSP